MSRNTKRGLGMGLSALLADGGTDEPEQTLPRERMLPIEFLVASKLQPRRRFDEEEIEGLTESVRAKGVLQPLLVRPVDQFGDRYEIIAGERRWRAAQRAGLLEVPVVVRELSDIDALEAALLENVQRQDLTPLEEAEGYRRLIQDFGHNHEHLGRILGRSRSHIANTLRLLELPSGVRPLVEDGRLSAGHARALLTATDPLGLAREVLRRGLNVRQTEALVREAASARPKSAPVARDPDVVELERSLANELGLKVKLKSRGARGSVTISYSNLEQLDDLLRRLRH